MFEIQIGDKLSLKSSAVESPLLVLGSTGQGKSTTLIQVVLELIKNNQTGVLYDPYGDLVKAIQKNVISENLKNRFVVFDGSISEEDIKENIGNKFILVSTRKLKEGGRHTQGKAQSIIQIFFKYLQKDQWCVIDEAFEYLTDDIIENYFDLMQKGRKFIFSDVSLINLSEQERSKFISEIDNYIIYKTRNVDAQWLEENNKNFNAQNIKAIKQYHFQCLHNGELEYSPSLWPIRTI